MSEMIPFEKSGELTVKDLKGSLIKAKQEMSSGEVIPFLKLTKQGIWEYGADQVEVENESEWALNPLSLQHGWISWGEGEVLGEAMVPITAPRPALADMEETGEKWDEQISVQMCCVKGVDKGVNVLYKTTSRGGKQAMGKYLSALEAQLDVDQDKIVAVYQLDQSSYPHKKYGKIYTPVFTNKDWMSMAGK